MEESLKSARLGHTALFVICATIVASVIGRDSGPRYRDALDELGHFQQLLGDLPKSLERQDELLCQQMPKKLRARFRLTRALPDRDTVHLGPFCEYLNRETGLLFVPESDDLQKVLQSADGLNHVQMLRDRLDPDAPLLVALQPEPGAAKPSAELFAEYRPDGWPTERYSLGKVSGHYQLVDDVTFRTLLVVNELQHFHDGRWVVLNKARRIWEELSARTLYQAIEYAERRLEESQKQINVFGVPVERDHLALVGPALIVMNLLYLLTLVRHVLSIRSGHDRLLREFPWRAALSGTAGRFLSCVAMPVATCGVLLFGLRHVTDPGVFWPAVAISAFAGVCGWLVFRETGRLTEES